MKLIACAALLAAAFSARATAAEIMVLGTFHFANPGQDVINIETDDVLAPHRQAEIQAVTDALATFRPTKIIIEQTLEREAEFNETYDAWRRGEHELTRNERQQLGMRLAGALDHDRLYAVDVRTEFDFEGAMAAGGEAGQTDLLDTIAANIETFTAIGESMQGPDITIGQSLRHHNDEYMTNSNHFYLVLAPLGTSANPAGAEMVAQWYRRNLLIFANIMRLIENEDERILVIYGGGHRAHLVDFIDQHPDVVNVSPLDYLPE